MAIQITYQSSVYNTANTSATYVCSPTWTPPANSLLIAFVCTTYSASPTAPTSVTGHGITYTRLTTGGSTLSTTHQLAMYAALSGASPTSAACTANCTTTNGTGGVVIEFGVTGADVSGTAANAIVNSGYSNTGTSATPTVTLSAPGDPLNRGMTFCVVLANAAPTTSGSWLLTTGAAGNFNTPATGAVGLFENNQFDTAGACNTSNANWRILGLEIKASKTMAMPMIWKAGIGSVQAYGQGVLL